MRKIKLFSNRKFGIFVCVFVLIIPIAGKLCYNNIYKQQKIIHSIYRFKISQPMELLKLCDYEIQIEEKPKKQLFTISAYDLSYSSVQNSKGISRGGIDLRGHTWRTIKVIATDPKVIPLRTKVRIEFLDKKHKKYNGIYISGDCGSAIKGKRIDLFIEDSGEKRSKEAIEFGITQAIIEIL